MKKPGPPLESLIDRLIAIPGDFFIKDVKSSGSKVQIHVPAIVNDLLLDTIGITLSDDEISKHFQENSSNKTGSKSVKNINYPALVAILCYIYKDKFFENNKTLDESIKKFLLSQGLSELSKAVDSADEFITDPERREEICRKALDAAGYYPEGENEKNSADRLLTLDSVERKKILIKTNEARKRAKELQEAMLRKEAEEAASKMSRE